MDKKSVVAFFATTGTEWEKLQCQIFNLDIIISIGYRVKSKRGTQFRIWANKVLKEYLIKGYALNNRILKQKNELYKDLQKSLSYHK